MYYTIGQVSKMFNLPISTLRYYDKEGLLPNLKRRGSIRQFDDDDLETLNVIECLKISGLEIKDIKQFMAWCAEGSATYGKRLEMFKERKKQIEEEKARLARVEAMINFKCWYYTTALENGNEEGIKEMLPNNLPKEIQEYYNLGHNITD